MRDIAEMVEARPVHEGRPIKALDVVSGRDTPGRRGDDVASTATASGSREVDARASLVIDR